jgi:hypothetical protein
VKIVNNSRTAYINILNGVKCQSTGMFIDPEEDSTSVSELLNVKMGLEQSWSLKNNVKVKLPPEGIFGGVWRCGSAHS